MYKKFEEFCRLSLSYSERRGMSIFQKLIFAKSIEEGERLHCFIYRPKSTIELFQKISYLNQPLFLIFVIASIRLLTSSLSKIMEI